MMRLIKRLGRSLLHLLVGLVILVGSAIGLFIFLVIAVIRYAAIALWKVCLLLGALTLFFVTTAFNPEPRDVRH